MKINDVLEVEIIKFDYFGNGIAKKDGYTIFVIGALPNEVCKIQMIEVKKDFGRAKILEIIKKSSLRCKKMCNHYEVCGGCDLLHIKDDLDYKINKIEELLDKKVDYSFNSDFKYRNKAIFHVKDNKIGFYISNTNKVVEIDDCITLNPIILNIYYKLKELDLNNIDYIMVRVSHYTNEVMVVIKGRDIIDVSSLREVNSIYFNNKLIYGNDYIYEKVNDLVFRVSPNSFLQINTLVSEELYKRVKDNIDNNSKVLDLYSGIGTISLNISDKCDRVIGIEVIKDAVDDAIENALINKISNVNFILGRVEDNLDYFKDIDIIIVDPPRSGLDKDIIDKINNYNINKVIYISCNPITLKRDLKLLNDYKIEKLEVFNMFKGTSHVECLTILTKK